MVISHRLWRERFGGDPAVLGRTLSGPQGSWSSCRRRRIPLWADIWLPMSARPASDRSSRSATCVDSDVVARLRDGVTLQQARAQMNAIAPSRRRLPRRGRVHARGAGLVARRAVRRCGTAAPGARGRCPAGPAHRVRECRQSHAGACDHARARAGRARGPRCGARPPRAPVPHRGALLALAGGAVGVLLATSAVKAFTAVAPSALPRLDEVAVDGRALLFTLVVSIGAALLFGILPALRAASPDLASRLRRHCGRGYGPAERAAVIRSLSRRSL